MSARTYLIRSAAFVLSLTAAVIVIAGYYRNPAMLPNQVMFIAGPSLVPFAILSAGRMRSGGVWLVFAIPLAIAWGYVAYVDSRPDQGGGASFAVFAGWAGCMAASIAALMAVGLRRLFHAVSIALKQRAARDPAGP